VSEEVVIPKRFNGPPASGHGGYSCGVAAATVEGPVQVSLRAPPPLDTPLDVEETETGTRLLDGETVVASVDRLESELELEVPEPPPYEEAERAALDEIPNHPFPTCFGCGHQREPGDGLRVFAGPLNGTKMAAAPWTPDWSLPAAGGALTDEMIWAALDCPSSLPAASPGNDPPIVLGRLAARSIAPTRVGEPHTVVSWLLERDGRKRHTGVALHSADGELRAVGRALWIALR
jgi:hypothetical protein